jgi:hypothetical protein
MPATPPSSLMGATTPSTPSNSPVSNASPLVGDRYSGSTANQ